MSHINYIGGSVNAAAEYQDYLARLGAEKRARPSTFDSAIDPEREPDHEGEGPSDGGTGGETDGDPEDEPGLPAKV